MKCYRCGNELSQNDFCTACGADVAIYKKIIYMSNAYYNDGLQKAQVRDLSGAVESLRQSLKCNKNNIEARNLLGLVYYELGEPVLALAEWVISKNFRNKKNVADDFMHAVQSNPGKLDQLNQVIKKYNLSLMYCQQDSMDMAIIQLKKILTINPHYIKALQLLCLIYINNEEWAKAKKLIIRILRIDVNNTKALYYLKQIEEATVGTEDKKKKKAAEETIVYQSGNETIIQPVPPAEHKGLRMTLSALGGLVIGMLIMWVIVLPARIRVAQNSLNSQLLEVSGELTEKSASLEEVQLRVNALEKENAELMETSGLTASDNELVEATEQLLTATNAYMQNPEGVIEIADSLTKIDDKFKNVENSSQAFRDLYDTLSKEVGSKASSIYFDKGMEAMDSSDYATAIEDLSKAYELDNSNGSALLNLGHAYRRNEEDAKAEATYRKVISNFSGTQYASDAQEYVTGDLPEAEVEQEASDDNHGPENPTNTAETTEVTNGGVTVITPNMVAGDENQ